MALPVPLGRVPPDRHGEGGENAAFRDVLYGRDGVDIEEEGGPHAGVLDHGHVAVIALRGAQ